ncbi:MAG: hypothetical protein KAY22_06575 [Rhizorhabdus sp.]|uniref:hypothetical protein n=1 Tax=Rhizorhabdus sp. TaxID=1968843 RepID=UPI001B7C7C9C|nr:hypothetical protein [Rhizorhabdus sp.]MBP8231953.1 hypothetical protein [Rhizorhabdus sp.]
MTVSTLTSTISYIESAAATYPVPFRFLSNADLRVTRIEDGEVSYLALGTDYTVAGANAPGGGSITRVGDAHVGATLKIARETVPVQPTDYVANDRFPAESHERALDRLTLLAQENKAQNAETDARALKVPPGETIDPLPPADERAGKFAVFGPGGGMTYASGTGSDADLREDLAGDPGPGLIKFSWASTYLSKSVGEKLQRAPINVTDDPFDCHPSNTNNRDGLQRVADKLDSWQGGKAILPSGRGLSYRVAGTVDWPPNSTLEGDATAIGGYGIINEAAASILNTGTTVTFNLPRTNGGFAALVDIGIFGTEGAPGAIIFGDGYGQEEFTTNPLLRRVFIGDFDTDGAIALDILGIQRGYVEDFYWFHNYTHVRMGPSVGIDFQRGNFGPTTGGKAYDATTAGAGGVNLSSTEVYYESCGGQHPLDFSAVGGAITFRGGGFESMCRSRPGEGPTENPAIFRLGPNMQADIRVRTADWGSYPDDPVEGPAYTGIISFIERSSGPALVYVEVAQATVNYNKATGLRTGDSYQFIRGGDYSSRTIVGPGEYRAPFFSVAEARAMYAPTDNGTYAPYHIDQRGVLIRTNAGSYVQKIDSYRRTEPKVTSGNVQIPTYTGVIEGVATTVVWTETYQINEFPPSRTLLLNIDGERAGTNGTKTLQMVISDTGTPRVIDLTTAATAADDFHVAVRIRSYGRLHQKVTIVLSDGSTHNVTHKILLSGKDYAAFDNQTYPVTVQLRCAVAAAGDSMTVLDVTEEMK